MKAIYAARITRQIICKLVYSEFGINVLSIGENIVKRPRVIYLKRDLVSNLKVKKQVLNLLVLCRDISRVMALKLGLVRELKGTRSKL